MMLMLAAAFLSAFAMSALGTSPALANPTGLVVTVDISPELKARTNPEQAVFIYAKAVNGPKAPLAAVKTQVKGLPVTVTLDDSRALTPRFKLSNFKEVEVSAHVSQNGQAVRRSGDLEGVSPQITLGEMNRPLRVIIDHVIP